MLNVVHGKEPKLNFCELLEAAFCNHERKHYMLLNSELKHWSVTNQVRIAVKPL